MRRFDRAIITLAVLINVLWLSALGVVYWVKHDKPEVVSLRANAPRSVVLSNVPNNPQVTGLGADATLETKRQRLLSLRRIAATAPAAP